METAQQAVKTLTALWLQELQAGRSDEANVLKQEVKEAKKDAFSCAPPVLLLGDMLSSQQGSARR